MHQLTKTYLKKTVDKKDKQEYFYKCIGYLGPEVLDVVEKMLHEAYVEGFDKGLGTPEMDAR